MIRCSISRSACPDGAPAVGRGRSRRAAEAAAAELLLTHLRSESGG